MMARLLPQPKTFPDHAKTEFYCWCVPNYELVHRDDGSYALVIIHTDPSDG